MNIKPLGNRVVVKPISDDERVRKTEFGIIIPDSSKDKEINKGTIIAVGDGIYINGEKIPVSVKIDDDIIFSEYNADKIEIDGIEYYIISEDNILAVVEDDSKIYKDADIETASENTSCAEIKIK